MYSFSFNLNSIFYESQNFGTEQQMPDYIIVFSILCFRQIWVKLGFSQNTAFVFQSSRENQKSAGWLKDSDFKNV